MRAVIRMVLALGVPIAGAQSVHADCFAFSTIDVPTPDGRTGTTTLQDVNNRGVIVGGYVDSNPPHGFRVMRNGSPEPVTLPGNGGVVHGISNGGALVGWYSTNTPAALHGYVRNADGSVTTLDAPGGNLTEALGINEQGHVVGDYRDAATGAFRGFVWANRRFSTIDLPFPNVSTTAAAGINSLGDVVGFFSDSGSPGSMRGFLRRNGVATIIEVPGAMSTSPADINDRGTIVGSYADAEGTVHGFVLERGVYRTIDVPFAGAELTEIAGINDAGDIVGRYYAGEQSRGFIGSVNGAPPTCS